MKVDKIAALSLAREDDDGLVSSPAPRPHKNPEKQWSRPFPST